MDHEAYLKYLVPEILAFRLFLNLSLVVSNIPFVLVKTMLVIQSDLLDALHFFMVEDLISAKNLKKVQHSSVNFCMPHEITENPANNHIRIEVKNDDDVDYVLL